MNVSKICVILMLIFFPILDAQAYLDAGTGSLLLQLLFGGIAGTLAIVKLYWNQIKEKIFNIRKDESKNEDNVAQPIDEENNSEQY